jgi:amino acid transporter
MLISKRNSFKKIGQILTGIATIATLWAGRVMAAGAVSKPLIIAQEEVKEVEINNPAMAGAAAARADGMPAELLGYNGTFTNLANTILYIVGLVSVVMLIFGGLRYVVSGGDSKKVTDAKNTVLYAIIGLIISFLAYAIVQFVISALPSKQQEQQPANNTQPTSLVLEAEA